MPKILIIDDDPQVCKTMASILGRMDLGVDYSLTLKQGLDKLFSHEFDILFLDVNLPDGNGLEAIKMIKELPSAPEIIIMTGTCDPDGAELAMESKAWDYIQKGGAGGSHKEIKFSLTRALEYRRQKQAQNRKIPFNKEGIIGESRLIVKCFERVSRAAINDISVLITGETGTGKELFSRAIHKNSRQSRAEFVVVDCTALPEHLVESTLFGHAKGAFTGADSDKTGLMKMADKGTLFLDEVGELPLGIQKKFLRALQEKKFRPVGGTREVSSDFRLICATHRDLKKMVEQRRFREDLFFRIFSMHIHLPPLRDRENDIQAIALNQLGKKCQGKDRPCTMSQEFSEEVQMYAWPGNVRELINTMDQVCSRAGAGSILFPHHLPGHIRGVNIRNRLQFPKGHDESTSLSALNQPLKFKDHIEKTKYTYLGDLLASSKGDIKQACRISGLSRSQLYRLIQQYDLKIII